MLELEQTQETEQRDVYSYDIFDTLIIRTVAEPTGIFSIVEHKLQTEQKYNSIPQILRQNFYEIRINSEGYARSHKRYLNNCFQDLTFSEIYEYIQASYNLNEKQVQMLMDLELQTEMNNIRPILKNINVLKADCGEGFCENAKVLISDMYHTEATIRDMLSRLDDVFKDIKIYVSGEYNKLKATGDLYKHVEQAENVSFANWTHYGDNLHSDVDMAKKLGIKAVHMPQEQLMPYEKFLLKDGFHNENDIYNQIIVGCSKYTRTVSEDKSRAYQFGCSFAAPILYPYVNWIIEQAVARNIKTLHFIARDGYILKLIAEEIVRQKRLDIKLNYLYGSRKAWRLPTEETYEDFINYMLSEYIGFMTPDFIAKRFNMQVSELEKYYGKELPNRVLTDTERANLKEVLLNSVPFKKDIILNHSKKVELLQEYFKQEFGNDDNIGVVDLYGTGRTQDLLAKILFKDNSKILNSFYFSTTPKRPINSRNNKLVFFSNVKYDDFWLELFCRTTYGQTIGYKQENNKIVPIMENISTRNIIDWGYESYKQGLIDYTHNIIETERKNNISTTSLKTYIKYYNYYKYRLDKDTASIIGDIPYALVGDETNVTACAPEFTEGDYQKMKNEGNNDFNKPLSFISFRRSDPKFAKLYERNKKKVNSKGDIKKKHGNSKVDTKKKYLYKVFSVVNSNNKKHKIITILGIKLKFKRRRNV